MILNGLMKIEIAILNTIEGKTSTSIAHSRTPEEVVALSGEEFEFKMTAFLKKKGIITSVMT